MYAFFTGLTGLASINCLAAISVDRYLVVAHPLFMLDKSSSSRVIGNLVVIWSWAALWATPPVVGWGDYILEGFGVSCTFDYLSQTASNVAYNYCLFYCGFAIPLLIIIVSYIGIFVEVKRWSNKVKLSKAFTSRTSDESQIDSSKGRFRKKQQAWLRDERHKSEEFELKFLNKKKFFISKNSPPPKVLMSLRQQKQRLTSHKSLISNNEYRTLNLQSGAGGDKMASLLQHNRRQEMKITKVLASCIVSFCICWVPYALVTQLAINGLQDYVTPHVAELPVMLAKSSSIWNPIIYSLNHPRYIQALKSKGVFVKFRRVISGQWMATSEGPLKSRSSVVA